MNTGAERPAGIGLRVNGALAASTDRPVGARSRAWPALVRYGLTLVVALLALRGQLAIEGARLPRVGLFLVAVVTVATLFGRGPGFFAIALSLGAYFAFFTDANAGPPVLLMLTAFTTIAGVMVLLVEALDAARARSRESERRYTNLVEQLPDIVFRIDRSYRHLYVSAVAERVVGVPAADLLGRTARAAGLRPDTADAFEAACHDVFAHGCERLIEFRGTRRAFRTRLVPERDPQGVVRTILGITEDVTERANAESEREALLRSAEQARAEAEAALHEADRWDRVFQEAHFGLVHVEARTNTFLAVNPTFAREHGYTREELVGQPVATVFPSEQRADVEGLSARADALGHLVFETVHQRKDGSCFPVLVDVTTIAGDGGRVATRVAHVIDLTTRKQAEEAVRQTEEQFRTLADSIPQLAWMARPDGELFWFNRRWSDYTGLRSGSEDPAAWQRAHDPRELSRVLDSWHAALAKGEPWEGVFALRRHDGEYRPHLTRAMPVRDASGAIVRWFGTNTDIAQQKRAESRITELLREAEDRDRRKDEFLAMLAHELRNPLAPIRNATEILRLLSPAEARLVRARELIERQVVHMTRLVDDLLDVSRITRGTVVLRKAPMRLTAVVDDAIDAVRPIITEHGHVLTVTHDAGDVEIDGDHARLVQVLANLLTNAAKFTPDGGSIEVVTRRTPAGEAEVTVRDSGIGIPAAIQRDVFDLFAQEDTGLARTRGGLGIGLTLVKRIVELHGGHVAVASRGRGLGTTFTVTLPALTAARPRARAVRRGPSTAERPLAVLMVEDNADAAESFRMVLELEGHQVRVARDGPEALHLVNERVPDVAFIDIGLPGMDGFELATRLRADPRCAGVRLLALTGYGRDEDKERARAAGFDLHMTKPVDIDLLQATLTGRPDVSAQAVD